MICNYDNGDEDCSTINWDNGSDDNNNNNNNDSVNNTFNS